MKLKLRIAVAGFGSIGKRHAENLLKLDFTDIVLFRREKKGNSLGLDEITNLQDLMVNKPNAILICTPTSCHFDLIKIANDNKIPILCEKPLVTNLKDLQYVMENVSYKNYVSVAYNMRYHPCLKFISDFLQKEHLGKPHFARFFVGQYLPDWKKNWNHLESYSAKTSLGGGVLFDLIHEVDMSQFLFGKNKDNLSANFYKLSNITIDSEDIAEITYLSDRNTLVNIHLDYLYRGYKRDLIIGLEKGTIHVNFHNNKITIRDEKQALIDNVEYAEYERNKMYIDLLKDFINKIVDFNNLSSFEDPALEMILNIKNR
jgi:predicted dehydrogenase